MKVKVYRHGDEALSQAYELHPDEAARRHCEEQGIHIIGEEKQEADIIVVPLDDEARVLEGWHVGGAGGRYKMYRVRPTVKWEAIEVQTFRRESAR